MASKKAKSRSGYGAIRTLEIENFKAIDHLKLDFPKPKFKDEPDIWVLGSKNGLGKTSVLQAISLLVLGAHFSRPKLQLRERELDLDFGSLWVRAGAEQAEVSATFDGGAKASFRLHQSGETEWDGTDALQKAFNPGRSLQMNLDYCLLSLAGQVSDPVVLPHLLFFHSYRRVQEGNPELGMLLDGPEAFLPYFRRRGTLSVFKAELLKLIMGKAELFESMEEGPGGTLPEFEGLLKTYANARLGKLKPERGSTLDIRLKVADSEHTISFDGLSSGQKEIISTLFLVTRHSRRDGGMLCLIDEPELHLNAEWHAQMVQDLHRLAPHSQFILASHSEQVFAAVDPSHRMILESDRP